VDGDSDVGTLGQAGYAITGSGGGGADGEYVFASLEELDAIIAEWEALQQRIRHRATKLVRAKSLIEPPADDVMSQLQAKAAIRSLEKAEEHRQAMEDYAAGFVAKLRAARTQYASTDADNAAALRETGKE
jgi:hypothetical protein